MKKYNNTRIEDILNYFQKHLPSERVALLRVLTCHSQFEKLNQSGIKVHNIWIFKPTGRAYIVPQEWEDGKYRDPHPMENKYIMLLCFESLLTKEEDKLATDYEENISRQERESKRIEKILQTAERVESWSDPVCDDGEWYRDVDSFVEAVCDYNVEGFIEEQNLSLQDFIDCFPSFVSTTLPENIVPKLGADIITERLTEDMHCDDYEPNFEGEEELQIALDKFTEANKDNIVWVQNDKKILMLEKELTEAYNYYNSK